MFIIRALIKQPQRPQGDVTVIYRSDRVLIRMCKGQNNKLVLCFNGLFLGESGMPRLEFKRFASEGRQHNLLYITDLTYSYYSQTGVRDEIIREVSRFIETSGFECRWAIGNSSGGYGAMAFAGAFDLSNVVAFVPALSVSPDMVGGPEWDECRALLGPEILPSALDAVTDTNARFCLIYGNQDADDNNQRARLQGIAPARSLHMLEVDGLDHTVAPHLKRSNLLGPIVSAGLFGSDADVAATFQSIPESVYLFADANEPAYATFSFKEGETHVEL
jgi:hypothetical protein